MSSTDTATSSSSTYHFHQNVPIDDDCAIDDSPKKLMKPSRVQSVS